MHRYNNKYGYGDILRAYCGAKPSTPVWGEIQHSLFLNTHYFSADGRLGPPREQLQRFPRLLSWQNLLPFPYQIPIGDPLLYQQEGKGISLSAEMTIPGLRGDYAVFMPKLNDEVPLPERLSHYVTGARLALEQSGSQPLVIALHPRETQYDAEVDTALADIAPVLWAPADFPGGSAAWSQNLVRHSKRVFSDYFGAHVFRASWIHDVPVGLVGDRVVNPATHPAMLDYLWGFLEAPSNLVTQREIAGVVLGASFVRSREELSDIAGFIGWKRLLGRPVRVVYQRIRRARVARRRLVSARPPANS